LSLLDTNVLSEVWHPKGSAMVKHRVSSARESVRVSVVTMGEIQRGILSLAKGTRRTLLEDYYREIRDDYGHRIVPVTLRVAEWWAEMTLLARRNGRVLHPADGLIAATAYANDMTLWTRNTRDFEGLGIDLFNPWED
jgi:predicted nucleic acid-binding protein